MTNDNDEVTMDEAMKYPANPLTAIDNGCMLDLRVKLAVQFLAGAGFSSLDFDEYPIPAQAHAVYALDVATELLAEAERRGLVKGLPETGDISAPVKRHIERNVSAALHQNEHAMREQRRTTTVVPTHPGMAFPQ